MILYSYVNKRIVLIITHCTSVFTHFYHLYFSHYRMVHFSYHPQSQLPHKKTCLMYPPLTHTEQKSFYILFCGGGGHGWQMRMIIKAVYVKWTHFALTSYSLLPAVFTSMTTIFLYKKAAVNMFIIITSSYKYLFSIHVPFCVNILSH